MPKNIALLKQERAAKVKQLRSFLDKAEAEKRSLTSDEQTQYDTLRAEVENRNTEIRREEELQSLEAGTAKESGDTDPSVIRSFGEFLQEVRFNPNSNHLQVRQVSGGSGKERRDMTMGNGASAGILVPEEYDKTIRMVDPAAAIFRPSCMVIPAGSSPDASISLQALDQSGSKGVYGGVVVKWVAENGTRQDGGDPRITSIKIEPQEVSAYIDISDKLLRNATAAGEYAQKMLRNAIIGAEEDCFFTGDGVGKPLGIIGHPSAITVNRATASSIVYADLVNMYANAKFGGTLQWVANQKALTKLMVMKDDAGQLIWQPNARDGNPNTLMGLPLRFNDQSPILGSEGDIALVDLQYYCIKDGSPLAIFMDPYTQKVNGVTRMYAFWNVDGQPMLSTPMLQRDGVSRVSPFVVLK